MTEEVQEQQQEESELSTWEQQDEFDNDQIISMMTGAGNESLVDHRWDKEKREWITRLSISGVYAAAKLQGGLTTKEMKWELNEDGTAWRAHCIVLDMNTNEERYGACVEPIKHRSGKTNDHAWTMAIHKAERNGLQHHLRADISAGVIADFLHRKYGEAGPPTGPPPQQDTSRQQQHGNGKQQSGNGGAPPLVNEFDLDFDSEGVSQQNEAFRKAWFSDDGARQDELKQAGYRVFNKEGKWVVGNNRLKNVKPVQKPQSSNQASGPGLDLKTRFSNEIKARINDFKILYAGQNEYPPATSALRAIAFKYKIDWDPKGTVKLGELMTEQQMSECLAGLIAHRGDPEKIGDFFAEFRPSSASHAKQGDRVEEQDIPFA